MGTTEVARLAGETARANILTAATEHFAEHGFRRTSLAAVARAAGLSQAGLLHHFPSKKRLLAAVLGSRDVEDLQLLAQGLDHAGGDLMAVLDLLPEVVRANSHRMTVVRLAHVCALESDASDWARQRRQAVRNIFESAALRSAELGTAREDVDAAQVASLIIATFEGLENQWLLDPDFDMVAPMQAMVDMLRRDLTNT